MQAPPNRLAIRYDGAPPETAADPALAADRPPAPTPEGPVVDIHKPEPVHSLREFFSEIGVIVCGALIALALEQAVGAFHSAEKVQKAKASIHQELVVATIFTEERIAREQRADAYVGDLASNVVASGPHWVPKLNSLCGHPSAEVYYGICRSWPTEASRSIETEGVASHFVGDYGRSAAFTFGFIKHIGEVTTEESEQAAPLDALNGFVA